MAYFLRAVHWVTAAALLSSLYAHTALGLDPIDVTPLAAFVFLASLGVSALVSVPLAHRLVPQSPLRRLAAILALLTLVLFFGLSLIHAVSQFPDNQDIAKFLLQCGLPLLLLLQSDRRGLFSTICNICVVAALVDAVWNLVCYIGIASPVARAQRFTEFGSLERFPGLTGSTLAAGEVAMVAVCFLSARLAATSSWMWRAILAIALLICLSDMVLIDARRFTGKAVVACLMFLVPGAKKAPLHFVTIAIAGIYFCLTFWSADPENILRSNLMTQGWDDAQSSLWTGSGIHYTKAEGVTFTSLWASGITESGIVSMIQQFGAPTTAIFFLFSLLALAARRFQLDEVPIIFMMLLADMECNTTIDGFLGAAIFFTALLIMLFEEAPRRQCLTGCSMPRRALMQSLPEPKIAS